MNKLLYIPVFLGFAALFVLHGVNFLLAFLMSFIAEGIQWCEERARR